MSSSSEATVRAPRDLQLEARITVRGRGGQLDADELLLLVNLVGRDVALALRTPLDRVQVILAHHEEVVE